MTDDPFAEASNVYFDANAFICYLEGEPHFQTPIADLFRRLNGQGCRFLTNEIALVECLYGAYKIASRELEERYSELFFGLGPFDVVPVDFSMLDAAARFGARAGLKLLDATHLVCALSRDCQVLVTSDRKLKAVQNLAVVRVEDL
jgi:Predicted nucleic acid-binding protein, contains PIN domain